MDRKKRFELTQKILSELEASDASSAKGNLSGRARLIALFDEGSFTPTSAYSKIGGDSPMADELEGIFAGYGAINGRPAFAYAQDFTKLKGAFTSAQAAKILNIYDLAQKNSAPIIAIFDSAGASIPEGLDVLGAYSAILARAAALSGVIPQIAAICGICSGAAAMLAQMSDFAVIEKTNGQLFINSPFVLKAEGADADIGSADAALKNGMAALGADGDEGVLAQVKAILGHLPLNNSDELTFCPNNDDASRLTDGIAPLITSDSYEMRNVISQLADDGFFLELYPDCADNMLVGFASINSISVGFVANQPSKYDGVICSAAARKAAKFIGICDSFNLPVITLTDTAGMAISAEQEATLALDSAKLAYAYAAATVPKVTVICGKAYGSAYSIMGSKQLGADVVFALPTAEISIMAPESAVNFVWKDKISAGEDHAVLNDKWSAEIASPIAAAKAGHIDAIIKPEQTRARIAAALEMLSCKKVCTPEKKHFNFPI